MPVRMHRILTCPPTLSTGITGSTERRRLVGGRAGSCAGQGGTCSVVKCCHCRCAPAETYSAVATAAASSAYTNLTAMSPRSRYASSTRASFLPLKNGIYAIIL